MLQGPWIRLWDDLSFILSQVNFSFLNEKQDYSNVMLLKEALHKK